VDAERPDRTIEIIEAALADLGIMAPAPVRVFCSADPRV
jgi:hypothetical protein